MLGMHKSRRFFIKCKPNVIFYSIFLFIYFVVYLINYIYYYIYIYIKKIKYIHICKYTSII